MSRSQIQPLLRIAIIFMISMLIGASFIGIATGLSIDFNEQLRTNENKYAAENFELKTSTRSVLKKEEFELTFPEFHITTEGDYSKLDVNGLTKVGGFGEPELSIETKTFKFKPFTNILSVNFIPGEIGSESLTAPITPVQEPIPVSEIYDVYSYGEPDPTPPNPTIYSSSDTFPESWFKTDSGMGLDFNTGLTTLFFNVRIYPVRYIPAHNELIYISTGKLAIEYEQPSADDSSVKTESIDRSQPQPLNEHYRLLIIGPELFRQNLTRLATYKNNTGIPAKFVSLTEINSGKYFTTQGVDQQEKIKYFIYNAHKNWNITYVILGADTPLIPHRNAYISGEEGNVPADLYYADLYDSSMQFCDWDDNSDSVYGEYDSGNVDKADLYSDVILGRLPASTDSELKVLVDKIINYESFTSGQTWFDNVTMCGTDTFSGTGTPEGEYTCEQIESRYLDDFVTTKIYETTTYERDLACTSTNIVNTLNKGAGFATFHDHGSPTSWAGKFSNSNALSLTNGDKMPFLNFDACSTGYFDRSSGDCISEVVVLNSKGGAITSIGASRIGYGQWGTAHITRYSGYFNVHLYDNYYNGEGTAGRIFEGSKHDYLDNVGISSFPDFKTIVEYTLFGDPSLSVGGIPLQNINISCENNESYIDPSGSAEFEITITNNGTFSRPIKLYLSGVPEQWSAYLNESLVIVPGMGEYNIKLMVNASETAIFKEVANIEVYAFFSKNKDRTISVTTKSITTRIYGLDLNTTQLEDSVYPGEDASFWFRVYNTGNAVDSIDINTSLLTPAIGWIFKLSHGKLQLEPFSSQLITLKIDIPEQTLFGSYEINVSSEVVGFLGDEPKDHVFVKVNILRTYGLEFDTDDELSQILLPGDNFTYHLNIDNLGNFEDKYQLAMLMYPPTWNITLSNTKQFTVNAFSKVTEKLYFEIPEQTLVGKYILKVRAQSTGNYSILENIMFEVRINRTYGMEVSIDVANVSGGPGDIKDFNLTIYHYGNDDDLVKFNILNLPSTWYYNITDEISLEPFQVYTIPFQVSSYIYAENGTYPFMVELALMGNLMNVKVSLNYTIKPIYGFEFYVNKDHFNVDVGGSQRYSFNLENKGNHEDDFVFNITKLPDNWTAVWTPMSIDDNSYSLDAYKNTNAIFLKITSDPEAIAQQYHMVVSAKLVSTGEVIDIEIILEVNPFYKISLDMESDYSAISVEPGDEFSISINITNHGNGKDNVTRLLLGIPESWNIRAPRNYTFNLEPYQKRKEIIRFEVPLEEYERDINLTVSTNSEGNPNLFDQERSTISVELEPIKQDTDESYDIGDFDQVFEQAYFLTICLPIIVLIIAVIIVVVISIRYRRQYKAEMHDLDEIASYDDEDYYADNYDEEAERLYGPGKARPHGHGRTPPPPPPPPASKSGHRRKRLDDDHREGIRWLDDEHEQDNEVRHGNEPYSDSKTRYKKGKKVPRRLSTTRRGSISNTICPYCGEDVSLDVDECPYCGEQFGDLEEPDHVEDWDSDDDEEFDEKQKESVVEDWDSDEDLEDEDYEDEIELDDDEDDDDEEFEYEEEEEYEDDFEEFEFEDDFDGEEEKEEEEDLEVDWE